MVWVNGHAMGRFWEIGPQQTLFMPGCWLKKGVNEIIVLDLKGPKEATIVGLNKPILDMLRVAVPETHRKQGQTIKLEKETPVSAGTFKPGNGWQEVKVPVTKGRYFCLEGLSSFDNTNIAAIAEFDVLDEKERKSLVKTGRLFMPTARKPVAVTAQPTRFMTCKKVLSGRR